MDEVIFDQCMRGLDPDGADRFLGFSDGIGSKEKSIIDRHMVLASSNTMYDGSLTVFPLPRERVGIMRTFRTSDGSRPWPFNHALITSRDNYEGLRANPFLLVRLGNVFRVDSAAERKLSQIRIPLETLVSQSQATDPPDATLSEIETITREFNALSDEVLEAFLNGLLASSCESVKGPRRMLVFTRERTDMLAEALLLTVPLYVRSRLSFTTCLTEFEEKSECRVREGLTEYPEEEPSAYEVKWCFVPLSELDRRAAFIEGRRGVSYIEWKPPLLTGEGFPKHPYAERFVELRRDQSALADFLASANEAGLKNSLKSFVEGHRLVADLKHLDNKAFQKRARAIDKASPYHDSNVLDQYAKRIIVELCDVIRTGDDPKWLAAFLNDYVNLSQTYARYLAQHVGAPEVTREQCPFAVNRLLRLVKNARATEYPVPAFVKLVRSIFTHIQPNKPLYEAFLAQLQPYARQRIHLLLHQREHSEDDLNEFEVYRDYYPDTVSRDDGLLVFLNEVFTSPNPVAFEKAQGYAEFLDLRYGERHEAICNDQGLTTALREEHLRRLREDFYSVYDRILRALLREGKHPPLCAHLMARCVSLLTHSRKERARDFIFECANSWPSQVTDVVIKTIVTETIARWEKKEVCELLSMLIDLIRLERVPESIVSALCNLPEQHGLAGYKVFTSLCRHLDPVPVSFQDSRVLEHFGGLAVRYYDLPGDAESRTQSLIVGGRTLQDTSQRMYQAYLSALDRGDLAQRDAARNLRYAAKGKKGKTYGISSAEEAPPGQHIRVEFAPQWKPLPAEPSQKSHGPRLSWTDQMEEVIWRALPWIVTFIMGFLSGFVANTLLSSGIR
ncbi:MAG: hypothetical protein KA184_00850 [Candidatus Hydrogenedentes bacterium]|nr:hypothetical protein [Candidatus Hydrogenedentota bacterium]